MRVLLESYPASFEHIGEWAKSHRRPVVEARLRFAQYGILLAIARSRALRPLLVFKGGNALDFVWQANRSTRDLDFSVDGSSLEEGELSSRLQFALDAVGRSIEVFYRVHRILRRPPGADKTFVTLHAKVGFALRDDFEVQRRLQNGQASPHVVPLDISLNEPICAATEARVDDRNSIRVSAVEDIVAEKLRALLQQVLRDRYRCQDVLDLALLVEQFRPDPGRVGSYLLRKGEARNVVVTRSAFYDVGVEERAHHGYDDLRATAREKFVPFDKAFATILSFVDQLPIPAGDQLER